MQIPAVQCQEPLRRMRFDDRRGIEVEVLNGQ